MKWSLLQRVAARARALPLASGRWALVIAALAIVQPAQAQNNDHSLSRAEILETILVGNEADMDFGDITPWGTNGTVVMTPAASATCATTGGITRTGACVAAMFEGVASYRFLLRVTKPAGNQVTLTGPGGATMQLDTFTFGAGPGMNALGGPPNATERRFRILNLDGSFSLHVGGTLRVAGNQPPGVYNGTFTLSFNYD